MGRTLVEYSGPIDSYILMKTAIVFAVLLFFAHIHCYAEIQNQKQADSTEIEKLLVNHIIENYINALDSGNKNPEVYKLKILDSILFEEDYLYAASFKYDWKGFGNRTIRNLIFYYQILDSTLVEIGVTYCGALGHGSFFYWDDKIYFEVSTHYGATGFISTTYSLHQIRPKILEDIFWHRLYDWGQVKETDLTNSYIKIATINPDSIQTIRVETKSFLKNFGDSLSKNTGRDKIEIFHYDPQKFKFELYIPTKEEKEKYSEYFWNNVPIRFEDKLKDTLNLL